VKISGAVTQKRELETAEGS